MKLFPKTSNKGRRFERSSNPNRTLRTLEVLELYNKGMYAKQIASKLNIGKSTVAYHTKLLLNMGMLEEKLWSSYKQFDVTDAGRTAIERKGFDELPYTMTEQRLHGIQISVPVAVPHEIEGFWGPENTGLKNQVQRFATIPKLHVTLQEIKSKDHTTLNIKTNSDYPLTKADITATNIVFDVYEYLLGMGYIIDRKRYKVTDLHGWDGEPDSEQLAKDFPHSEVALGRKRAKLTGRDPNQEAKVRTDSTPADGIESNCVGYLKKKVMMPEYVYDMHRDIRTLTEATNSLAEASTEYAQNLNAHLPALKAIKKVADKLNRQISQRHITEFIGKQRKISDY